MKYLINSITDYIVNNSLNSEEESLFAINGFEDIEIYARLCQNITNLLEGSGKTINIKLANRKWEHFKKKYAGTPFIHLMEQNNWIAAGKSTTYYRNLHATDVLILMGVEDEDDAVGSLKEISTITPQAVVDLIPKIKGKTAYDRIFGFAQDFSEDHKNVVNKLYRDLFEFVTPDILKLSEFADKWESQVTTINDFIELFFKELPQWGLPTKADNLPKASSIKGKTNFLRQEFNFITGQMFASLSLSKYKSFESKFEKYDEEHKKYSSDWEGWANQPVTSYEQFKDVVLEFIGGERTTKLSHVLLNTDFSVVEEILSLKIVKEKTPTEGIKISGDPLYAFAKATMDIMTECQEKEIQFSQLVFQFDEATIVVDDDEEDALVNQWRNICIHTNGVFEYINNKAMFTLGGEEISVACEPENFFEISMVEKPYVYKASGNKNVNKIDFKVYCVNEDGEIVAQSPKKDCQWLFKSDEAWTSYFTKLCNQDFVKNYNNGIIPVATNNKMKSLVLSKSTDDFMEILNAESDTVFDCNLLDRQIHPMNFEKHELYMSFVELGMKFSYLAYELSSLGIYNVLLNCSGVDSLNKLINSYTKLGKEILSKKINEDEDYIPSYYIHAFNIEESDASIKSEVEIQYCIVPPWHPAALEKFKHMNGFFMDGCHEYWKEVEESEEKASKKLTEERLDELKELSLYQNAVDLFPTSGAAYFGVKKNHGMYTVYSTSDVKSESTFRDLINKESIFDDDFKEKSYSVMNDDALMIFNVIENYIKAFPNSKDNLNLVFVDPMDLQPVIAAVHKYIAEYHSEYGDESTLSITLRVLVKPENMGGKNYLTYWMNETFDLDSFVKVKTYLNVWGSQSELENYLDENHDIVFVMDLLKTNDFSFIENLDAYKPSHSECYFPIVFRPGLISISSSNRRRIELTQPQFEASTVHTQVVYYKKHLESSISSRSFYAVKNVVMNDEGQNIIKSLHDKAYWVVCIDNGMDGALLKDKASSGQDYSVIGFSTGKGRFGQYNLTITARNSIVKSIEKKFSNRLTKMFHWDANLIAKASKTCMDEASFLDGVSVLRASNKNDYNINEFMAYVLTSLREKESGNASPLKTIVHLDSYKHWFSGKGDTKSIFDPDFSKSRPDFLVLEVDPDYTGKIKIHAKIVECKISGIANKTEHVNKAVGQVKHGVEVLSKIFDPNSASLKRRYWFAQLYRALAFAQVTFKNTDEEFHKVSNKLREILDGSFDIDWTGEVLGYWVDLHGESDTATMYDGVVINNIPQVRIQKLLLGDSSQNVTYASDIDVSLFRDGEEEIESIKKREKEIEEEFEQTHNKSQNQSEVKDKPQEEKKYSHVDFDLEESVILLNSLNTKEELNKTYREAADELSIILRSRATTLGFEIDDSFRSSEGLMGRLRTMKMALDGLEDSMIPQIFKDAVNLYNQKDNQFIDILKKWGIASESAMDKPKDSADGGINQLSKPADDISNNHSDDNVAIETKPLEEARVMIGHSKSADKVYWEFGHKQLANRHLLITGTSGQGKTYGIQTMLYELSKSNISSVIFDYTEGFTPDQLESKFKEKMDGRIHQEIVISTGVPINPFKRHEIEIAGMKMLEKIESVANRISFIFTHVYAFGEQQSSAIFNAARNGLKKYGDNMNMDYFREELEAVKATNPAAKTVISKMEPFLYSIEFTSNSDFDWSKILYADQAKVNIFQLTGISKDMQVIITELMLWDVWYYTQKHGTKDKPFVVVLDEAQNLSHKDSSPSAKILTEGRKFGWSAWYATQSLKVLSDDEVVRLMQAAYKLYFKPTDDEIPKISKQIDPTDGSAWLSSIKNLNKGQCICVGDRIRPDGSFGSVKPCVVAVESFDGRE